MGDDRFLRTLLAARPRRSRLASLLQRQLGIYRCRLVLGQRRALGLGHVSLRPMGFRRPIRLVLGAANAMGASLGFMARRRRLCRLGAIATVGYYFGWGLWRI